MKGASILFPDLDQHHPRRGMPVVGVPENSAPFPAIEGDAHAPFSPQIQLGLQSINFHPVRRSGIQHRFQASHCASINAVLGRYAWQAWLRWRPARSQRISGSCPPLSPSKRNRKLPSLKGLLLVIRRRGKPESSRQNASNGGYLQPSDKPESQTYCGRMPAARHCRLAGTGWV